MSDDGPLRRRFDRDRAFRFDLNSVFLLVQLLVLSIGGFAWWSQTYAEYRRDAEMIAVLRLQVSELEKSDKSFAMTLSDRQLETATRLIGIERDVDYIKQAVERLEKASQSQPRAP